VHSNYLQTIIHVLRAIVDIAAMPLQLQILLDAHIVHSETALKCRTISFLNETARSSNIPIHSRALLAANLSGLQTFRTIQGLSWQPISVGLLQFVDIMSNCSHLSFPLSVSLASTLPLLFSISNSNLLELVTALHYS